MTKKIAVINDLSGLGRCSLTAAISVITVMGVQACPFPTAVLSAQTGYPDFYCDDNRDRMEKIRSHWEKLGESFDGIYTGFVAGEEQIDHIFRFLDTFYKKKAFLLVDPVMGDEGHVYKMYTGELLQRMKELVSRADIITPNLTELCLLTGTDYRMLQAMEDNESHLIAAIEQMARNLLQNGPHTVVVTGIRFRSQGDGEQKIGNIAVTKKRTKLSAFPYIGGSFSGTGDLFASVIAGGRARGDDIFELIDLAGVFIERAMKDSVRQQVDRNAGVNYEQFLGMLAGRVAG